MSLGTSWDDIFVAINELEDQMPLGRAVVLIWFILKPRPSAILCTHSPHSRTIALEN